MSLASLLDTSYVLDTGYLAVVVALVVVMTERWRLAGFLALGVAATLFGLATSFPMTLIGRDFGLGFAQTLAAVGLPLAAGAIIAGLADLSGATARLAAASAGWSGARRAAAALVLGLVGGLGASPTASLAAVAPLGRAIGGSGRRSALTLALALSAGHAALFPSPLVIAGGAILGADFWLVAAYGLPVALAAALAGAVVATIAGRRAVAPADVPLFAAVGTPEVAAPPPAAGGGRGAGALIFVTLVLVALLVVQSLGDMPSEPFGGGPVREAIQGVGRPLVLVLVGVGLMLAFCGRAGTAAVGEDGTIGRALGAAAPLMLAVGSAGGLQIVLQRTGVAELAAEQLTGLPIGLALPFLLAAVVKVLQGSSLVAAITAAGMMAPLVAPLGLDGGHDRALAAVALGVGAMTGAHVNDGFFWIVASLARLRPACGLGLITIGTLVQGVVGLAVVYLLAAVV